MQTQQQVYIKMALDAWKNENKKLDQLLSALSEEQLMSEVAPGRNSGIYLLGHLAAVNDAMLPLLGIADKLYPQLEQIFLSNNDKSGLAKPAISDLKKYWETINAKLNKHFDEMKPEEWFSRHNSVSEEDFTKEPHRNKLNIIISRTIHQSYHLGQLALLR